ncbi:hypothetical protein EVAR_32261_1 [Eumeta japonica]|uniref:Uncharacterized protein n=1 Tax=Eumeta variegata TaxID=151549 RepID=A0A4C1WYE6_EUMVA|nr:hypothetical protein EVAR_32261_1 [Eumeta japonica]
MYAYGAYALLTYSSDFGAARLDLCELRTVVPYTYTSSERSAELHGEGNRDYSSGGSSSGPDSRRLRETNFKLRLVNTSKRKIIWGQGASAPLLPRGHQTSKCGIA